MDDASCMRTSLVGGVVAKPRCDNIAVGSVVFSCVSLQMGHDMASPATGSYATVTIMDVSSFSIKNPK